MAARVPSDVPAFLQTEQCSVWASPELRRDRVWSGASGGTRYRRRVRLPSRTGISLRVLHFSTRLISGGAERNMLALLSCAGDDELHRFLAGQVDVEFARAAESLGATVGTVEGLANSIRPHTDWSAVAACRRAIREFRPDVVHTHESKAGVVGRLAAWLERVPAVHSLHITPFAPVSRYWPLWLIEASIARTAREYVAVSYGVEQIARRRAVIRRDQRCEIVRSPIDVASFLALRCRSRPEFDARQPLQVGVLGRLEKRKRPWAAIDAARRAQSHGVDVRLHFAGAGTTEIRTGLTSQAGRAGIDLVHHGHVDTVDFFRRLDVLLHVADREGLPRVVVEAAAAGIPVVARDSGSISEVIEHGVSGWIASGDRDLARGLLWASRGASQTDEAAFAPWSAPLAANRMSEIYRRLNRSDEAHSGLLRL